MFAIRSFFITIVFIFGFPSFSQTDSLRVACYFYDPENIYEDSSVIHPGLPWVWAKNELGQSVYLDGAYEDGFFVVDEVEGLSLTSNEQLKGVINKICNNGIKNYFKKNYQQKILIKAGVKSSFLSLNSYSIVFNDNSEEVDRIVIFGDSMSDTGNIKNWLRIFPDEPYVAGRFSNGPIWVDYLGINSSIPVQNFALGGLTTRKDEEIFDSILDKVRFSITSSLDKEINNYHKKSLNEKHITRPNNTLFYIWTGGNDYLNMLSSDKINIFLDEPEDVMYGYFSYVDRTTDGIVESLQNLYNLGGRKFFLLNLPDMGLIPKLKYNSTYHNNFNEDAYEKLFALSSGMTMVSDTHNILLAQKIDDFLKKNSDVEIAFLDVNQMVDRIMSNTSLDNEDEFFNYGLYEELYSTKLTVDEKNLLIGQECYTGYGIMRDFENVCENPSEKIFWDYAHATTYMQCLVAGKMHQFAGEHGLLPYKYWKDYLPGCHLKP